MEKTAEAPAGASPVDVYEEFLGELPEKSPRFAIFDFEFEKEGAGKRNKILFVSW